MQFLKLRAIRFFNFFKKYKTKLGNTNENKKEDENSKNCWFGKLKISNLGNLQFGKFQKICNTENSKYFPNFPISKIIKFPKFFNVENEQIFQTWKFGKLS